MARSYSSRTLYGKMFSVEIVYLGAELRRHRVAAGRTIASVAADAGLSVPYIANLENGRGNPTLSAVNRLAEALGVRLAADIRESGREEAAEAVPETLVRFASSARFVEESARLAHAERAPAALVRQRLIGAMSAMAAVTAKPMSELDWHRVLDTVVLIARP